jgi:hypothetical protein
MPNPATRAHKVSIDILCKKTEKNGNAPI